MIYDFKMTKEKIFTETGFLYKNMSMQHLIIRKKIGLEAHLALAVKVWSCPVSVVNAGCSVEIRIHLVLLLVLSSFVEAEFDLHIYFLKRVMVGAPALLQELEPLVVEVDLVGTVQPGKVFNLELASVQLLLVGEWCKERAVRKLVSLPVSAS